MARSRNHYERTTDLDRLQELLPSALVRRSPCRRVSREVGNARVRAQHLATPTAIFKEFEMRDGGSPSVVGSRRTRDHRANINGPNDPEAKGQQNRIRVGSSAANGIRRNRQPRIGRVFRFPRVGVCGRIAVLGHSPACQRMRAARMRRTSRRIGRRQQRPSERLRGDRDQPLPRRRPSGRSDCRAARVAVGGGRPVSPIRR